MTIDEVEIAAGWIARYGRQRASLNRAYDLDRLAHLASVWAGGDVTPSAFLRAAAAAGYSYRRTAGGRTLLDLGTSRTAPRSMWRR